MIRRRFDWCTNEANIWEFRQYFVTIANRAGKIQATTACALRHLLSCFQVSYSEQAIFSLVSLPFSLKLLWAPLVSFVCIYTG